MRTQIIKNTGAIVMALMAVAGAGVLQRQPAAMVVAEVELTPQPRATPDGAVGARPLPTGPGGMQDTPAKTGLGNAEGKGGMGGATTGPGTEVVPEPQK